MILYVNPTGIKPSGVATFGYQLLERFGDARLLLLDADEFPPTAAKAIHSRIHLLGPQLSHSPQKIAAAILEIVDQSSDDKIAIFPNNSDVVWLATAEALKAYQGPKTLRVMGMVHSDMHTQYDVAQTYEPIAPVWIAVSKQCTLNLKPRIKGASIHTVVYPPKLRETPPPAKPTDGPLKLAYIGRLDQEQKNIMRFVELFETLKARDVDFTATMAGSGRQEVEFSDAIQAKGLGDCVNLPGALNSHQIEEILLSHHLFVLLSSYEGFPLALQEAMAHELCPVVMQIDSNYDDILEDGRNARILPQSDIEAVADAIEELAAQRERIATLAQQARADLSEKLNPEECYQRFQAALDELFASSEPQPDQIPADPTSVELAHMADQAKALGKPVALYGAGSVGRRLIDEMHNRGVEVQALFDSSESMHGQTFAGVNCRSPEEIPNFAHCAFTVGSLFFANEIAQTIRTHFPDNQPPQFILPTKCKTS